MSEQGLVVSAPPTPLPIAIQSPSVSPVTEKIVENGRSISASSGIIQREPVDLPRRKRVQSAIEPRQILSLSIANTSYGNQAWGETSYSADYSKKKPAGLPKVRPSSATRMNNPHPSYMFLQWRIPTRIHKHDRAVAPSAEILKDIEEDFYKDYSSNIRPGDDKYEVPITNVAKIPFPGKTDLELSGKGITHAATRRSSVGSQDEKFHLLEKVLKPHSYAALKDWMKEANEREKEMFEKMICATQLGKKCETKEVLTQVFSPNSMRHIQKWLKTIGQEERNLAMSVLRDIATRSQKYREKPAATHRHRHAKHCKAHTWPKQKVVTSHSQSPLELGVQGMSLHQTRSHSAGKCSHCSDSEIGSTYKHIKREKSKVCEPGLWNHRVMSAPKPRLLNIGCVFNRPQQLKGQHFSIHPEWPIA